MFLCQTYDGWHASFCCILIGDVIYTKTIKGCDLCRNMYLLVKKNSGGNKHE